MNNKQLAMKNINNALSILKKSKSLQNNNKAMIQLQKAQRTYDGARGMDMENIFNTNRIYSKNVATPLLNAFQEVKENSLTAKKHRICKQNLAYLKKNQPPLVHLPNSFTSTYQMKPINHQELTNLAKGLKRTVQFPPHAYTMMASAKDANPDLKGENVNYALRCTFNYCIKHHQQSVLQKNHLAESRQVLDTVSSLYSPKASKRVQRQMESIHSIGAFPQILDVVKVNHPTTDSISVSRPTVKDVKNVIQGIHDNMYPNRKLTHKHSLSKQINHLSDNHKHTYIRAHQSGSRHNRKQTLKAQQRNQQIQR